MSTGATAIEFDIPLLLPDDEPYLDAYLDQIRQSAEERLTEQAVVVAAHPILLSVD